MENGDSACGLYDRVAVVPFLYVKVTVAEYIRKEICTSYEEKFISSKAQHNWVESIFQGRTNPRVALESIAAAVGCFHGLLYWIMHDRLNFRKVCAR